MSITEKIFCKKDILQALSQSHPFYPSWRMVRSICHVCISILLFTSCLPFCFARDTITLTDFISERESIISAGDIFELGFFIPGNGSNDPRARRYVGIWYYRSDPRIIVWVANRDHPLNNSNGVFGIAEDGNLVLYDGHNNSVWNTNHGGSVPFTGMAKLFDSGNLQVLSKVGYRVNDSLSVIWESFKNPTDTFLPGMKMDENLILNSWASLDNPAKGEFKFQKEDTNYVIKTERPFPHWKSGVSGNFIPDDILRTVSSLLSNFTGSDLDPGPIIRNNSSISNTDRTRSSTVIKTNLRLVMNSDGNIQYYSRDNESTPWELTWSKPTDSCDVFKACGNCASCNISNSLMCECLPGFEPNSPQRWNIRDFTEGCDRKTPLCSSNVEKIRDFSSLKVIKVGEPDGNFEADSENECKEACLMRCDCQAYSYTNTTPSQLRGDNVAGNITCWVWSESLNNIQEDDRDGVKEIHLRVQQQIIGAETNQTKPDGGGKLDESHKQFNFKHWPLVIAAIVVASVTALACTVVYIYRRKKKLQREENRARNLHLRFYDSHGLNDEDNEGIDLPFFDFESILVATDNFSEANKLGKGGFGPVYKGNFPGGREMAVKRLSRVSVQGMEEFKNEVVMIARLQHRNLVRLLGYCIQGDEKILLYEFMPNKSLDSFLFDPNLNELLDWEIRFNIILGITRGLIYLHQDSRLRIIHRDLKTSNILLDGEMNPKISDFGLARIFEGKQTEGATNRVVGTYGYMSPEYALDGFFSVKSDVYSFGVMVLEIISGKKNTGFYNSEEALSLLGYAWRLWQEDKALDMMDQKLSADSESKTEEILKCINVGLLCVQEDPDDRPTMSDVVILLSSVTATLPTPKQPAFVLRRVHNSMAASSSSKAETHNQITVSLVGR